MPQRNALEVVPDGGDWAVTVNGERLGTFGTQEQAIDKAVVAAKQNQPAELKIKGKDGRIRDSRTYGDDPRSTPG
jgi:hypothetical protein